MKTVTDLIKILNKPALLKWANMIGLDGVSLKDYRAKSTYDGIKMHKNIELYLRSGVIFDEYEKLDHCLDGYNIVGIESDISNGFIYGRVDLILERDGVITIVDFKSNDKIYLDHKLQLSTYKEIYGADSIAIIDFTLWELKCINIDTSLYYEIMKRLYQIDDLIVRLNERL